MNVITEGAYIYQITNETIWSNVDFGGEFLFLVKGKTGIIKGRKNSMLYDVGSFYPRAYFHSNKIHPNPPSYIQQRISEVWNLIQKF